MIEPVTRRHVFLLGPMGSGKSKLGKQLATKLGLPFIDLDQYIETAANQTITALFQKDGEEYFRVLESQYLKEVAALPAAVVSLGGGTPCFFNNMDIITQSGRSIYLQTPVAILASRLAGAKTARPLLHGKDEAAIKDFLEQQLVAREPFYLQADKVVANDGKLKVGDLVEVLG